jgi:multiple sugar transport system substrate-binding protein
MQSKKRFLFIIIAGVTIVLGILGFLLFRGSSGSDDDNSSGPIEIRYSGLWEPESHLREVIDRYEKENPNVTIKYTKKSFTQYEEYIYSRLTDPKTTPDIVRINNAWTYKFQDRLAPLPPEVMSPTEYQNTFFPTATNDFTGTDGQIYAIPLEIDGLALYYNKDLFDKADISEPPQDWDTFIQVAQKLTETDSSGNIVNAGAAIGCSNNINHSADIMFALMMQSNIELTDNTGTKAAFDTKEAEEVLTYYTNFVNKHEIWSCRLGNDLELFAQGKVAMMFGPSWRVFDIINMNSPINFDTAPLPQLPANNNNVNYAMYWGDAVSAQSPHQLEAWKFVKYMSEAEQLQSMYAAASESRTFGEPYSRKDLAESISQDPYVGVFMEMAPTMQGWQMGDQKTTEEAINKAINDVIDGRDQESNALRNAVETINTKNAEIYNFNATTSP